MEGRTKAEAAAADPEFRGDSSAGAAARYKLMSPTKLPISRPPCLTIPPGLSPSSFLESPVFLSNSKAEPSPTTGSFFKPQMVHGYGGSTTFGMNANKASCFEFPPTSSLGSSSVAGLSVEGPMTSADLNDKKTEQGLQVQAQCLSSVQEASWMTTLAMEADFYKPNQNSQPQSSCAGITPVMNERVSEDGYSWHKYGQKLVKGSEYPRSYYKCAHPNCEAKKLFECAPDGQITEIIYKGTHDHRKPQPNSRTSAGSMSIQEEQYEKFSSLAGQEDKPSLVSGQLAQNTDCTIAPELPPCTANEMILEDGVSQLNRIPVHKDADDDPFAKRRKIESDGVDMNSLIKHIREPRVVVQTLSEVDILDDGYRWRKYGQKVVKGNPNPRSYYKCTSAGCPVRKHVERAPHDPKAVITTYEGKHNHVRPTAKTNIYDSTANPASRVRPQDGETVTTKKSLNSDGHLPRIIFIPKSVGNRHDDSHEYRFPWPI